MGTYILIFPSVLENKDPMFRRVRRHFSDEFNNCAFFREMPVSSSRQIE